MKRDVGGVLLMLVGGAVLRISVTDAYLRYVKESMRPWLILAGVVLVVLGVLMLVDAWQDERRAARDRDAASDEGDAGTDPHGPTDESDHDHHGHSHAGPRAAWLLVLPVLAIYLVAPPALGAYTAERQDPSVAAPSSDSPFQPLPDGDPVDLEVGDFAARAVWDDGRTLTDRTVRLLGFVSEGDPGTWYVTRLSLSCCAADAFVVKVRVTNTDLAPAPDTWVQVTGRWVAGGGTQSSEAVPWLEASGVAVVDAPENPYE